MSTWEAPPAIMQHVMIGLCTDIDGDKFVAWRSLLRFATSDQIRPWTAHCILNDIRYKGTENDADSETEDSNVYPMGARSDYNGPQDNNP